MKIDSERDREILLNLVDNAVIPVAQAHIMLDLRERLRNAEVEQPESVPRKAVAIVMPDTYETAH